MPIDNQYAQACITHIHNQNVKLGWHDEPRSTAQYLDLFHSELSEATEGLRKNLMDDKLPAWPMWVVEFADYIIRVFDYMGLCKYKWGDTKGIAFFEPVDLPVDIANLHMLTSEAWLHRGSETLFYQLQRAVCLAWDAGEHAGYDMELVIASKVEYNENRPDHKRDARKLPGGKSW